MTLNFCQIQQLTTELAALELKKINVSTFSWLLMIDLILLKLADKEEKHTILDSNFGRIGQQTTELAALEYPKIPHWVIIGKIVSTFLAHLSQRLSSSIVHNAQRSSSAKPLCQSKPNFMLSLLGYGERNLVYSIRDSSPS